MTGTSGPARWAARDQRSGLGGGREAPPADHPAGMQRPVAGMLPEHRVPRCRSPLPESAAMSEPYSTRVKLIPAALRRSISAWPRATAGVTWPAVSGRSSRARRQRGLGQHLRGLAVSRVSPGHLGDDPRAAAIARRADEANLEPGLLALLGRRAVAGILELEQQVAGRRQLGQSDHRPEPADQPDGHRQSLDGQVVAVAEVRSVALQRRPQSAGRPADRWSASAGPSLRPPARGAADRRCPCTRRPSGRASARLRSPATWRALAQTPHGVDGRVERAAGERSPGPDEALDPQRARPRAAAGR